MDEIDSRERSSRRLELAVVAVSALALVFTGIGFALRHRSNGGDVAVSPSDPSSTTVAPHSQLMAHLELGSTSLAAGSSEAGFVVFENSTGASVKLDSDGSPGCTPHWGVVLRNARLNQTAAFHSDCGLRPLAIPPGETKLPFTLAATFMACSQTGPADDPLTPMCLPGDGGLTDPPPLPAGTYEATFFSDIAPKVSVAPMRVAVLPRVSPSSNP